MKNPAAVALGKLGGQARAAKHGKKKLKEWAKLGGRPRKEKPNA